MNTIAKKHLAESALALAVQGALLAMFAMPASAMAEDANPDVTALTQPTNSVEVGVENVSKKSAKFGEYNGLTDSGAKFIGNFNVRGGNAYTSEAGTYRWDLNGVDLGTTSREIGVNAGDQGKWNLGIRYDELRHAFTDTYQTPFTGAMGGNSFVLPASFGVIDATHAGDTGTGTQALTPEQLAAFHAESVYTARKNTSFTLGHNISEQWSVQLDYNHLNQSGAKLIGAAFDGSGGGAGENSATFMNPTNYKTDTYTLTLDWVGEKGQFTGSFFGSFFKDGYNSLSWSNPFVDNGLGNGLPPDAGVFPMNTFATAPNNNFRQVNLSGAYAFSQDTRVSGGVSYGRNSQNTNFINDPLFTDVLPRASLGGLVVTTHADLKLTNQATRDLLLSAALKYNERDNRTPSETYGSFMSVAGDPWGAVVNTPVSNRKSQLELAGNYRFDKTQSLRAAYTHEDMKRWCNNALANAAQSEDVLTVYPGYYTRNACVQTPQSKEDKLALNYKLKASKTVSVYAGYAYGKRRSEVNDAFYNPMQTSAEGLQNLGFMSYFDASRKEQLVKAGVTWQASDKLNFGLNSRYVDTKYDATLGVQKGQTWGMNFDAAYTYSENATVAAYLSFQRRTRDLLSGADQTPLDPSTNIWSNRLTDDNDTVGLNAKQKGMLGGKLELVENLSYSFGKTVYSTSLVNYTSVLCSTYGITCGELPAIENKLLKLKLTAAYQLDKASKVSLGYVFKKLVSNDYYYSAYQMGSTDVTVLPTDQLAPNHAVNVVGISYLYTFR